MMTLFIGKMISSSMHLEYSKYQNETCAFICVIVQAFLAVLSTLGLGVLLLADAAVASLAVQMQIMGTITVTYPLPKEGEGTFPVALAPQNVVLNNGIRNIRKWLNLLLQAIWFIWTVAIVIMLAAFLIQLDVEQDVVTKNPGLIILSCLGAFLSCDCVHL